MNIVVTCRHVSVTEAVRDYARRKAEKLSKYFDLIQSLEVTLSVARDLHKAEIVATAKRGPVMVATGETHEMHEALDLATARLERQLTKQKEKLKLHRVRKPEQAEQPRARQSSGDGAPLGEEGPDFNSDAQARSDE